MKRLLITGATGFVGRPCLTRAGDGFEVHATARRPPAEPLPHGVRFHPCDLFDPPAVADLLAAVRPTHLLHLAWIATPGIYQESPQNDDWLAASERLLTAFFRRGGERAVVTGSCAEYDWSGDGLCREALTPIRPTSRYGRAKAALYDRLRVYEPRLAWARLFFLYGPGEDPRRLVASLCRALARGTPAECSSGEQRRDFLHTADAADALVTLLASDGPSGPVNVGSGTAVPIRTVAETLGRLSGRPDLLRLGVRPTPTIEPPVVVADISRLRSEVGWSPRIPLDVGLAGCWDWWRTRNAA